MKRLGLLVALTALAVPVHAGPAHELIGTWECQAAGAPPTKTPPIVWFGEASADGKTIDSAVDLDGFARSVSGISDLASDAKGWWTVQPQDGVPFMVKPRPPLGKQLGAAMFLRLGQASYDCRRLPRLI
jgi:hypothetical protein